MKQRIGLALALPFLLVACGDSDDGGATGPLASTTGMIEVSLDVSGGTPDADGCRISIDDGSERTLLDGEAYTFDSVRAGDHVVTISDVAPNCSVQGETAHTVTVRRNQVSPVTFALACRTPLAGHIAFTSRRDGRYDIFVMRQDGSNPVKLTTGAVGGLQPAWSPDATRIAFAGSEEGAGGIYVMDSDGQNVRALTSDLGYWPSWSPQGDRIAYVRPASVPEAAWRIYLVDVDGTRNVPLTNAPTTGQYEPAWSPDGHWIAYTGIDSGDAEIFVIGANGGVPVNITNHSGTDDEAAWSPDGSRLAFRSYRNGVRGIYVMDLDGSNLALVVVGDCLGSPTWSPDGARIAYSGPCGSDYEIFSVRVDGSGLVQLTDTDADDTSPAWSPVP